MDIFPAASVVVVGYNSSEWLVPCLAALSRQDYPGPFEIIYVDNQSSDGSAELVRGQFPETRIIESGDNLGYAGGNNLGAAAAMGDVLAFANPDTLAESDWLRELVRPLVADDSVGLTTSKIVRMDQPAVINACGNDISLSGITTCHRAGQPSVGITMDEDILAVSGASFAIRSSLFHRLGGFDESFWMYLEDTDLSWRARMLGYRCVLAAKSVIAHDYSFSLTPKKTQLIERNRYLMLTKNLSISSMIWLLPGLFVGETLTWGWAAMHGWRHLWAKLCAIAWMFGNVGDVWRSRRRTQSTRALSDSAVLRGFQPAPAITEISAGLVGHAAQTVLVPLLATMAAVSLALISLFATDIAVDVRPSVGEVARDSGAGD